MAHIAQRRILALVLVSAIALTAASAADASATKVGTQIKIAKLSSATQKRLRHTGVTGPALTLLGTPSLAGSKFDGLSLYRAPWSKGGTCVSAVTGGIPDGADCDPKLFTSAEPGYATAGLFGITPSTSTTTSPIRFLLRDRDAKFTTAFDESSRARTSGSSARHRGHLKRTRSRSVSSARFAMNASTVS
jgi:hypothetical protein